MKSPRLLPVVIFATFALLVFKGIGLIADGGYVLAGVKAVHAEGAPGGAAPPAEPTMADASPTLTDTAPTLASPAPPQPAIAGAAGAKAATAATPAAPPLPANAIAATDIATPAAAGQTPSPSAPVATAVPKTPDAVAMQVDATGHVVPLTGPGGASLTDSAILQRLAERRAEIDKRQAALNMREAIVAAAEKQMVQRADALKSLEAQITALTKQRQAMQDEQFAGVVKMYETMKPQDAAAIFDGLDMSVLLRVAKAMDPRKMSPILAKMTATRAQQLTAQLAAGDGQDAPSLSSVASADPNALPQIVGH